jgi:hypothetical protein
MPPTAKQALGRKGEEAIRERIDLICKFCGFLAQVKSVTLSGDQLPVRVLGAAWGPQHQQILDGIFQPLFVVGYSASGSLVRIDYVPAHILQSSPQVFEPRAPLRSTARRAGWQGFVYNLQRIPEIGIVRMYP